MGTETFTPSDALQESFELYNPLTYLIEPSIPTQIHGVYKVLEHPPIDITKPIVFIIIGPSGAGKDTLADHLVLKGLVNKLTTATSRKRRIEQGEPEDAYIWMREKKREDESDEEYYANLIIEYNLIEHDGHHGSVYGLPYSSLENRTKKPSLIRTENKGLKTIMEKLQADYNIISVFIVPDNYEILLSRIQGRGNLELRMAKSVEEVKEARELVNYVILNGDNPEDEKYYGDGALKAKTGIQKLVMHIADRALES